MNSFSQTGTILVGNGVYYTFGGDNSVNNTDTINLSGGTLSSGLTTGYTDTLGMIKLSASSTINLGSASHKQVFSNSRIPDWAFDAQNFLKITGWVGNYGNSKTQGKIYVGTNATDTLTSQQLQRFHLKEKELVQCCYQLVNWCLL